MRALRHVGTGGDKFEGEETFWCDNGCEVYDIELAVRCYDELWNAGEVRSPM
jgi:hypothetical protein